MNCFLRANEEKRIHVTTDGSEDNESLGVHALVGISPFNSYYSYEKIHEILSWCCCRFSEVSVFFPDSLPIYNFLAMGYNLKRAQKKTTRQANYMINKINRSIETIIPIKNIDLILMSKLIENEVYQNIRALAEDLYDKDRNFQVACNQDVEGMLRNYHQTVSNHDLMLATKYLLYEIPLLSSSPLILDKTNSTFIYHETPAFVEYLYANLSRFIHCSQRYIRLSLK